MSSSTLEAQHESEKSDTIRRSSTPTTITNSNAAITPKVEQKAATAVKGEDDPGEVLSSSKDVEMQPVAAEKGEEDGEDRPPDGGYGWVVALCLVCVSAATWGMNTTYGVYSSYYIQNNHFDGGTTLKYAWVGGLSAACALVCGPLANWLCRIIGFRATMGIGAILVTLGQCLAGICTSFYTFLVCQGIIFGLGLGLTMIPCQPLLAHWFDRRLALAQGLANAGSGLGGLIWCNTTRLSLETLGVKWALIINGLISLVLLMPAIFLLKGRHKAVGARQAPLELKWLIHPGFVWVWIWGALVMMAYFIALYSLASFATHGLGFSQTQGAALQSILSAGQMIGRPAWGFLLDKGGRLNLTILCYILCGLSTLAIWLPSKSFGLLIFYALIQGITGGTVWSATTPVAARVVGVKDLSSALSLYWLALVIPCLVGQPIAVALLDYSEGTLGRQGAESYYISIGFCGGMALAAAGALMGAKRWLQGDWKILTKT